MNTLLSYRPHRSRLAYAAFLVLSTLLAFSTRWWPQYWPDLLAVYGGDYFSGWMALGLMGAIFPRFSIGRMCLACLILLWVDEATQAYHAPWADHLRDDYFIGGLLFGHGFLWSDIVCYTLGILTVCGVEAAWCGRKVFDPKTA